VKKVIGWPLAQALYYVGHWASLLVNRIDSDKEEPGRAFQAAWWVYQRSMGASLHVNDWAGLSIWKPEQPTRPERTTSTTGESNG
jgi:hypothetical protein